MSLVVTTYVPEGIVLASDSRQFVTIARKDSDGKDLPALEIVNSDSVFKTFSIEKQKVGINTFGQDLLNGIPTGSYLKQFEETLSDTDDIESIANKLLNFFQSISKDADTGFHVAGYKKEVLKEFQKTIKKEVSSPYVYYIHIKGNKFERINFKPEEKKVIYGATWGGEADIIAGLLKIGNQNAPQIAWEAMTLQDAIDFSIFTIGTTTNTMRFQARQKTVGGPIDVLLITPEGFDWVQKKQFHGEQK